MRTVHVSPSGGINVFLSSVRDLAWVMPLLALSRNPCSLDEAYLYDEGIWQYWDDEVSDKPIPISQSEYPFAVIVVWRQKWNKEEVAEILSFLTAGGAFVEPDEEVFEGEEKEENGQIALQLK